jgi:hypothetical protein
VPKHKFILGQSVRFTNGGHPGIGRDDYKITRLLPAEGLECEYRIKSAGEPFERVARESQLDRLPRHPK